MPEAPASSTQRMIAALWQRNRPQVQERLKNLDHAVAAVASRSLSSDQRDDAASNAHKFAGSLGMFGFHEGTRLARELQHELESPHPQHERLQILMQQLRHSLFPLETADPCNAPL